MDGFFGNSTTFDQSYYTDAMETEAEENSLCETTYTRGPNVKEMKVIPPYCTTCKAYIVSESSDEEEREAMLSNLTEWMAGADDEEDDYVDSKMAASKQWDNFRPAKGTILVILDNNSASAQKKTPDQDRFKVIDENSVSEGQ
eukprot:1950854-Ditylum_brightwellii.AAC.1